MWKIDKMTPTPIPEDQYGYFYTGDSYIVLYVSVTHDGGAWLSLLVLLLLVLLLLVLSSMLFMLFFFGVVVN